VRGCGQALSDLDELSFASSPLNCSVEQASVELPYRSALDTPQPLPAAPSAFFSLTLALDLGRATSHRIHAISTLLAADSSAPARASVRIVELQWDMQTGNFIEGSLDIITAATTPVPGGPQCLSALITSGYRCLQVIVNPSFSFISVYTSLKCFLSDSLQIHPPVISPAHLQRVRHRRHILFCSVPAHHLSPRQLIHQRSRALCHPRRSSRLPTASQRARLSRLFSRVIFCSHIQGKFHVPHHSLYNLCIVYVDAVHLTPQMQPPRSVLATHAFRAGSADRPQSISLDFVTAAQQQV
jgi:hypothetical protein